MSEVIPFEKWHYAPFNLGDAICGELKQHLCTGHAEQVTCRKCLNIMKQTNMVEKTEEQRKQILKELEQEDSK